MSSDPTTNEFLSLQTGDALPAERLRAVTARDATTVVLLAGPVGSGKTTMLVALYELFNEGPVGGLLFGGSATLVGFERICHPGRIASGLANPNTLRTPSSTAAFLHLRVAEMIGGGPRVSSVLISDVTGEAFDETRHVSEPTILPREIWRSAGMISVVLDGDVIAVATKRQVARTKARSLLRSAHESGLITRNCRLAIVTTKWDQVTTIDAEAFVEETESILKDQYGSDFASVTCHRIAARPKSEHFPYGYGLPNLLKEWISKIPSKTTIKVPDEVGNSGVNDFTRLYWDRERKSLSGVFDVF